MSDEITSPNVEAKPPTKEELAARKKELNKFYGEELPMLRKQAEYEELITRIDVAKFTRFEIMMQKAHLMQGQQEASQRPPVPTPEDDGEHIRPVNDEKKERVLKTEK